jgi:hypothetical protein
MDWTIKTEDNQITRIKVTVEMRVGRGKWVISDKIMSDFPRIVDDLVALLWARGSAVESLCVQYSDSVQYRVKLGAV